MKYPYISVVIPTLNEENFLPYLLTDLKKQKETDFEVIIVDGNSNDNTKKKALDYKSDLKITFYSVSKRNVSYQRNFGAAKANGAYICFFDADLRISPSFLKKVIKAIQKNKHLIYIPAVMPQDRTLHNMVTFNVLNFLIETSLKTAKPFSSGGSMIIEKNYFYFLGGFDENLFLAEDHEIIQRAKAGGVTAQLLYQSKVKVSLRRLKKEGRLDLYKKYLIATFHILRNGKIDQKIFEYKMGGDYYATEKNHSFSLEKLTKNYFQKLKKQLENFANE